MEFACLAPFVSVHSSSFCRLSHSRSFIVKTFQTERKSFFLETSNITYRFFMEDDFERKYIVRKKYIVRDSSSNVPNFWDYGSCHAVADFRTAWYQRPPARRDAGRGGEGGGQGTEQHLISLSLYSRLCEKV